MGALLIAGCLVAIAILIWLGHAWHNSPDRYFGERKVGIVLSFLNLVATGGLSGVIARRLGPVPLARFWWAAAVGFVWLGCDDLFTLHEDIDRGVHALLGWDPDHPVTDHLDDLIVAGYGLVAIVLAHRYRVDLARLTWMHLILAVAFAIFAGVVVLDVLHWAKTLEDVFKVVAGTLIFVGFFAARIQLAELGLAPRPVHLPYAWRAR